MASGNKYVSSLTAPFTNALFYIPIRFSIGTKSRTTFSINQSINQSDTKPRTTATCSNAFYPVYWLPIMIGSLRCFCLLRLFGAPFVLVLRHSIQNCSVDGSGYIPRNQHSDEHMKHLGFSFLFFIRPS